MSGYRFPLRAAWIAVGWVGVAAVTVLSLIPAPPELIPLDHGDKVGHLIAYGCLMFWFAQVYLRSRTRWLITVGLVALGIALEHVQGWTGWREFSYADMAADAIGVILGWAAAPERTPNLLSLASGWVYGSR